MGSQGEPEVDDGEQPSGAPAAAERSGNAPHADRRAERETEDDNGAERGEPSEAGAEQDTDSDLEAVRREEARRLAKSMQLGDFGQEILDEEGDELRVSPQELARRFERCEADFRTVVRAAGVMYEYRILGPRGEGCAVRSRFIENPNESWVGKPMTCVYDPSVAFERVIREALESPGSNASCSGPLYELMTQ